MPAKKLNIRKPVAAKPVTASTPAKPVAAKPAPAPAVAATDAAPKTPANVTRTIATIAKRATNFGGLSDRDNAYIAFFASFAKRDGGSVTIATLAASGARPSVPGSSAKPHDAGAVNRLVSAGLIREAGGVITFTDAGKSLAAYTATPARAKA